MSIGLFGVGLTWIGMYGIYAYLKSEATVMAEKLLKAIEVLRRVPVDRKTLDVWEADGKFPKRVRVGSAVFWRESDIDKWITDGGMPDSDPEAPDGMKDWPRGQHG